MTMLRRLTKILHEGLRKEVPGSAAAWRLVGLAVVLAVVAVAPVMAQTSTSTSATPNMSFPLLGTFPEQVTAIKTGFSVQWGLFGGFSGAKGNAMYYLALTFALVGLLLIIIMPKNRSPGVIIPWFMILLVMIFAPYNSKLLFWPIDNSTNASGSQTCVPFSGGTSVSSTVVAGGGGVCGFTPEVVAVHLGSTLAMVVSDIMTSQNIKDIVAASLAAAGWQNAQINKALPSTATEIQTHFKNCPGFAMVPACAQPNATSPTTAGGATPAAATTAAQPQTTGIQTFKDNLQTRLNPSNSNGNDNNFPAIILPKTQQDATALGYTTQQWAQYQVAMQAYYLKLTHQTEDQAQDAVQDGTAEDTIIQMTQGAQAGDGTTGTTNNKLGAGSAGFFLETYGNDQALKNYRAANMGTIKTAAGQASSDCDSLNSQSAEAGIVACAQPETTLTLADQIKDGLTNTGDDTSLNAFLKAMGSLPVAQSTVAVNGDATKADSYTTHSSGSGCPVSSEDDFFAALNKQVPGLSTNPTGAQIISAMKTCASGDVLSDALQDAMDNGQNTGPGADSLTALAKMVATSDGGLDGGGLANSLFNNWKNTMNQGSGNDPEKNTSSWRSNALTQDKDGNTTVGGSFLNGAAGIAAAIGVMIGGLAGHFVGLLAQTTLLIMRYFVDLMLMFMIMVTPFMFLMGLLIPSNAPGMIALTSLGMLVLTLVPMTIRIIDCLIGIVQQMQNQVMGGGIDGWLWDGIIQFAAAGMYLNVIGLTMFIMFKIGDPSNIRGLTEIERGAKEMATVGRDAVVAIGAAVGLGAVGAGMGAIGGGTKMAGAAKMFNKMAIQKAAGAIGGDSAGQMAASITSGGNGAPQPVGDVPGQSMGDDLTPVDGDTALPLNTAPEGEKDDSLWMNDGMTDYQGEGVKEELAEAGIGAAALGMAWGDASDGRIVPLGNGLEMMAGTDGKPVVRRSAKGQTLYDAPIGPEQPAGQTIYDGPIGPQQPPSGPMGAPTGGGGVMPGGGSGHVNSGIARAQTFQQGGGSASANGGTPMQVQVVGGKLDSVGTVTSAAVTGTGGLGQPGGGGGSGTGPASTPSDQKDTTPVAPGGRTKAGLRFNSDGSGTMITKGADGEWEEEVIPQAVLQNAKISGTADSEVELKGKTKKLLKGMTKAQELEEIGKTYMKDANSPAYSKMKSRFEKIAHEHDSRYRDEVIDSQRTMLEDRGLKANKIKLKKDLTGKIDGKPYTIPAGTEIEQFSVGGAAWKGLKRGALGGALGSLGGAGGGVGSLPFVKQALNVFNEGLNEFSQGLARTDLISNAAGGNAFSKMKNYAMMNSRVAHSQWEKKNWELMGMFASDAPNLSAFRNKANFAAAKDASNASDAAMVERHLAMATNKNAKDGAFSYEHHRKASRADAIAKVANIDHQAMTIEHARVEVNGKAFGMTPRILQEFANYKAHHANQKMVEDNFQTAASWEQKLMSRQSKMGKANKVIDVNGKPMQVIGTANDFSNPNVHIDLRDGNQAGLAMFYGVSNNYINAAELANHKGKLTGKMDTAMANFLRSEAGNNTAKGETPRDMNKVNDRHYDLPSAQRVQQAQKKSSGEFGAQDRMQAFLDRDDT